MYNNPYFNQQQRFQQPISNQYMNQQMIQPMQVLNNQMNLLGKIVESIDVVKAMDIPLDGSVSYYPLSDGSAIVSKQLQIDGTSKTIVYKPIENNEKQTDKYLTIDMFEDLLNDFQEFQDLKDEIKELKKQMKDLKLKRGKDDE